MDAPSIPGFFRACDKRLGDPKLTETSGLVGSAQLSAENHQWDALFRVADCASNKAIRRSRHGISTRTYFWFAGTAGVTTSTLITCSLGRLSRCPERPQLLHSVLLQAANHSDDDCFFGPSASTRAVYVAVEPVLN